MKLLTIILIFIGFIHQYSGQRSGPPPPPPPPLPPVPGESREPGYCETSSGQRQNVGMLQLNGTNYELVNDINTKRLEEACLAECRNYPRSTGCEIVWGQASRGCYVHTMEVKKGSGARKGYQHMCWIFSHLENDRMLKKLLEQEPVENVPIATFAPAPTTQRGECSENENLNVLGNYKQMIQNGWKFDLTHAGQNPWNLAYKFMRSFCGTSNNWYGWSTLKKVGTLSTVLKGSGKLTLNFGNCWHLGTVEVYLDKQLMAVAHPKSKKEVSLFFKQGSLLEIKDVGLGSVIQLNSITFECKKDACKNYNCQNEGKCIEKNGAPKCKCPRGYHGGHCEQKDVCYHFACLNRGHCVIENGNPKCICTPGYSGQHCEVKAAREGERCSGRMKCPEGLQCVGKILEVDGQGTCRKSSTNCPYGVPVVNCFKNPCQHSTCSDQRATCVPNYCGGCNAVWYDYTGQNKAKCLPNLFGCKGNEIALKDPHGKFLEILPSGEAVATGDTIRNGSRITFEDLGGDNFDETLTSYTDRKVALRSISGKYLVAYPSPNYEIKADGTSSARGGTFVLRHNDKAQKQYWFRTIYTKMENGEVKNLYMWDTNGKVQGDADNVRRWEKYTVTCLDDNGSKCIGPPTEGPCEALISGYTFDGLSQQCIPFQRGGCSTTKANGFKSKEECISKCLQSPYGGKTVEELREPICCHALTAFCEACKAGITVEEYCRLNPLMNGCPKGKKLEESGSQICCQALTASCEACKAGITVEEYCKLNPLMNGCPKGSSGAFAASMRTACSKGSSNKTIKSSHIGKFGFPVHGWEPNTFYEFEYNGRLLTGLPSLASHHSGVAINAIVRVFAEDANELVIQVFYPKYVEVNEVLYPKEEGPAMTYKNDGWNWRHLNLPPFKQMPREHVAILSTPIYVLIDDDGGIRSFTAEDWEPAWSINFKKGLISLFQKKIDESYSTELVRNMIEHPSNDRQTLWQVKEDSLHGRCQHTYQVNELPEHIIKENPELIPLPSKCPSDASERKYFEIIRTRNFNICEKRSDFNFFKPGHLNDETSSQSSVTRSIICASVAPVNASYTSSGIAKALRASQIVFQQIVNENEQEENMMGFNTEKFITGTKQTLSLRKADYVGPLLCPVPFVWNPTDFFDLIYEYNTKDRSNKRNEESELESNGRIMKNTNGLEGEILTVIRPSNGLSGLAGNSTTGLPSDQKQQMKKLIIDVVKSIVENNEAAKKSNINMNILSVARGFSMFAESQDIKQLWEEVDQSMTSNLTREVMRNVFVDTVAMAGTPATTEFILNLIKEDKMTKFQIFNFFTWMPTHIVYPALPILEKIYITIRSEKIHKHAPIRNIAIASFSQLLQQACIAEERKSSYPINVAGEFCNTHSKIVKEEWIPHLITEASHAHQSNDRNIYLLALGAIQHPDVIQALSLYASGDITLPREFGISTLNRLMAIYSLANIGSSQLQSAVPPLMAVFSNPTEAREIRLAAFNGLLMMNPPIAVFHRIAGITQEEQNMDLELLKAINSAFYSLGVQPTADSPTNAEFAKKAKLAYDLIKKVTTPLPTSGTIYSAKFLHKLGAGFESFISYVASETSILPKSMYADVRYLLDQVSVSPIKLGYRVSTTDEFLGKLAETLFTKLKGISPSTQVEENNLGGEWKEVIKKIKENQYVSQSSRASSGASLFVQLFESGPFYLSDEKFNPEELSLQILPYLKDPEKIMDLIDGESDFALQKSFNLAQMDRLIPSDMGFPIVMEYHNPRTVSFIGKKSAVITRESQKMQLSGQLVYAQQFTAYVGTVVPFSKEFVRTGVNHHSAVNVPIQADLNVHVPNQKLSIMFKPLPQVTGPIDIVHTHRYPFTVAQKIIDLTPIHEQSNLKKIKSSSDVKSSDIQFGDYLGLKLESKLETESQNLDFPTIFETLDLYDNNPLNLFMLPWTISPLSKKLTPSIRQHKYSIVFDPTNSPTKELGLEVNLGIATKSIGRSVADYYSLKVKTGSELSSSGPIEYSSKIVELLNTLSPYKVETKPIQQNGGTHQTREQKLNEIFESIDPHASATGITIQITGILKGRRPRTWTTSLTVLGGVQSENIAMVKQEWIIRLEKPDGSFESPKLLCVYGTLNVPFLSTLSSQDLNSSPIDFAFRNNIGMGLSSCNESSIITTGKLMVSEEQQQFSKQSKEYKSCQEMVQQGNSMAESSVDCKVANYQSRTLDTVKLTNQFKNVPNVISQVENGLAIFTKTYLLPFIRNVEQNDGRNSSKTTFSTSMDIKFAKNIPSFDLTIKRPKEEVSFKAVRVPYPFQSVAPLVAGFNGIQSSRNHLAKMSNVKTCKIEPKFITNFDGVRSKSYLDSCWNFVFMNERKFAMFVRKDDHHQLNVKLIRGTSKAIRSVVITWSESGEPKVEYENLEGQKMSFPLPVGKPKLVNGSFDYGYFAKRHNLVLIDNDSLSITVGVHSITILGENQATLNSRGSCAPQRQGTYQSKEIKSCIYSKPALDVVSNRIQTSACPRLGASLIQEFLKEKQQCHKLSMISNGFSRE